MAEREGICLTSMMLLVGLGMSQYSSTTKADIFLSIGLLVVRECISIDYQPATEVTRANTEIKGCDLPLEAKYMGIYLGNLSIEQMENRLGIKLTEDDKKQLWGHQPLAELKNKTDWHCFDIPFIIACGCMDTAIRINSVLSPYADQMKCQISIGIDNPKEAKQ